MGGDSKGERGDADEEEGDESRGKWRLSHQKTRERERRERLGRR